MYLAREALAITATFIRSAVAIVSGRPVDLVEDPAVGEMPGLRLRPSAEDVTHRE